MPLRKRRSSESSSSDDGISSSHQEDQKNTSVTTNNNNKKNDDIVVADEPQQGKSSKTRGRFGQFFLRIYFWIHIQWLLMTVKLFNYLHDIPPQDHQDQQNQNKNQKNKNKNKREKKLVHIGDDFGLGVGDWATFMGDAGLNQYIDIQQPLLLSKWVKLNECKYQSTTEDWLPASATASHFEDNFHPDTGKHRNASIVMITVGANDICPPSSSAQNLKAIITTLRKRMPWCLVIVNIPPVPPAVSSRDDDSKVKRRVMAKTDALREAVKNLIVQQQLLELVAAEDGSEKLGTFEMKAVEVASLNSLEAKGMVRFGIDLDEKFRQQPEAFCLGELFLKPRAYKEAVKRRLGEVVHLTQISAEKKDLMSLVK